MPKFQNIIFGHFLRGRIFNRGGHTDLEKKSTFFAPIWRAPEQVLNLRRQLSSSILSFVWHRSKLGPFAVHNTPSFLPKKYEYAQFVQVPDKLGSQIVLRIYWDPFRLAKKGSIFSQISMAPSSRYKYFLESFGTL